MESELIVKKQRYSELNNCVNDILGQEVKNKMINQYIDKFLSMESFSRELIINLVDKIEIFEDKTINIHLTFNNISV